jgi:hypothetical protein
MGKVGSTSILRSLVSQYPGLVLHAHVFDGHYYEPRVVRLHRWWTATGKSLKVISPVREPVARNVSAFFENFERETGVPFPESTFSIQELKKIFLSSYPHEEPLEWFDQHILSNFGIDVFDKPFPASGVATYAKNNVSILVMRAEISNTAKAQAIMHFLGLERFVIQDSNIGHAKPYAHIYAQFKRQVLLPQAYITRMHGSKYFRHFYGRCQPLVDSSSLKIATDSPGR